MLTKEDIRTASDVLWNLWNGCQRVDMLPNLYRPKTRTDGYSIQALLEQRSAAPLFGWKIAATSSAGQSHIGVDGPLAGRLISERAHDDGAYISLGDTLMRVAEPEFSFRMAYNLPPREQPYDMKEVVDAVESLHPAIEIPDSRYENFTTAGEAQLIADNACAHEFVLGAPAPVSWREIPLDLHRVQIEVSLGRSVKGIGRNVLGDPRIALTWLVNELSGLGVSLEEGQIVTTGTAATPFPISPGDKVCADFGCLGSVTANFVL